MRKVAIVVVFFVIAGFTFGIVSLKQKSKEKLKNIETVQPKIATVIDNRLISGVLLPAKEITIKSQISGILEELYVHVGDKIDNGDKIARIKLVADPNNVEIAEKNLKTAKIRFENEKLNFERSTHLHKNDFISDAEFEEVQKNLKIIEEEYFSAKNQLQIIREGFSSGQKEVSNIVKSTSSGTILELPLKEGASVIERNNFNEGSTIASIADLDYLVFKGNVNESDIIYLEKDQEFDITITALKNAKTKAKLSGISPKGTQQNGIMKFEIEASVVIPKETKMLRSGFTAVADIILNKRENVLTIEERNLQFNNDTAFVEIVDLNGELRKQNIKTGLSDGLIIEVVEGLTLKDRIKVI